MKKFVLSPCLQAAGSPAASKINLVPVTQAGPSFISFAGPFSVLFLTLSKSNFFSIVVRTIKKDTVAEIFDSRFFSIQITAQSRFAIGVVFGEKIDAKVAKIGFRAVI
jgi:hypothetical protein